MMPDIAVYREVNLEGAVSAILTYDYNNLLEGIDEVVLEISSNGGTSYTPVYTHTGAEFGENDSVTVDITSYAVEQHHHSFPCSCQG